MVSQPTVRRTPAAGYAVLAVALALMGQFLTVRYNYDGNWTGLFFTGDRSPPPPAPVFADTFVLADNTGYDAQFYRYIAHDPLLRKGYADYVDNPRLRWRRILIPALAHVLALGQPSNMDAAYLAITLGFLFLGVYWLGRYCERRQLHVAWSLAFLAVPAVMISIERLTIDIALATLSVGFILYAHSDRPKTLFAILVLAPLARETGVALPLAVSLSHAVRQRWGRAALTLTSLAPFLLWAFYVQQRTPPSGSHWLAVVPFYGVGATTVGLLGDWGSGPLTAFADAVHILAIAGVWASLILTARLLWRSSLGPVEAGIGLFALLAVFLGRLEAWSDAYAYGRFLAPLLIWLALRGVAARDWWGLLPVCLIAPRVVAQVATHLPGIAAGLLGG